MKNKTGLYWHVHHDKLIEYCWNYDERARFIRRCKPANEVETRLRLFKPVREELPKVVRTALKAYSKALKIVEKSWEGEYSKKWHTQYNEACNTLGEARRALDNIVQSNIPTFLKLHAKECPNCTWDGKTIHYDNS